MLSCNYALYACACLIYLQIQEHTRPEATSLLLLSLPIEIKIHPCIRLSSVSQLNKRAQPSPFRAGFLGALTSGFTLISPGLYSRTEVARRGSFTFINLRGTGDPNTKDFTVRTDGDNISADRQKGVYIEAEDPTHELTVYVLSNEKDYTDAYMAINCVEFPSIRPINSPGGGYQYYVFSSTTDGVRFKSQFIITPCENDTDIRVRPIINYSHPQWLNSSFSHH